MRSPSSQLSGHRRSPDRVTMTPMIDVVFLLIIFFLVSSHLSRRENRMPVSLAEAGTGSSSDAAELGITLTLDAQQRLYLAGKEISLDQLGQRLRAIGTKRSGQDSSSSVRLRVDRGIAYEHLEKLLGVLTEAGFDDVALVTNPSPPGTRQGISP